MTANHPEHLVARLTARASSANGNGRPAGGYWPDDAELDRQAATTITSLVGERDALKRERDEAFLYAKRLAEHFVGEHYSLPDWRPLPDLIGVLTQIDNMMTIARELRARAELAESTIRNRDETIAALRAALTRLLLRYDSVARDLGIEPDTQDVVITSRALASPHQEGTGT